MVKIVNYVKRQTEDGKVFFVLELQSGMVMVRSQKTGLYYATAKKASITSTFDEETCKTLIGTEIEGKILKVVSEPYQYTIKETGEILTLTHKYAYYQEHEMASDEDKAIQKLLAEEGTKSPNGVHNEELIS